MRSSALIRSKKFACFSPKFSERLPNIIRNKWLYSSFESSTDIRGAVGRKALLCPAGFWGAFKQKHRQKNPRNPARGGERLALSAEDRGFAQQCGKLCMGGRATPCACFASGSIFSPIATGERGGQSKTQAQESCMAIACPCNHIRCSCQGPRCLSRSQGGV